MKLQLKALQGLDRGIQQALLNQIRDLWTHTSTALEGNTLKGISYKRCLGLIDGLRCALPILHGMGYLAGSNATPWPCSCWDSYLTPTYQRLGNFRERLSPPPQPSLPPPGGKGLFWLSLSFSH